MSMKKIDFDTLCRICRHGYIKIGKFNCSHKNNEKKMTTTVDCPIWNSLPDVNEPDLTIYKRKANVVRERRLLKIQIEEQPTWLEYEGY